jgi:hypothetical protein
VEDDVLCQKYGTTGGIQQMGMHNRSENCRGAKVALCAYPTATDTDALYCYNVHHVPYNTLV